MSDFNYIANTRKFFQRPSLLDIAIGVEEFLDNSNLYIYPNWKKGYIVNGPIVTRYWVETTLRYKKNQMPDPLGARILYDIGVLTKYVTISVNEPQPINTPNDYRENSKKPKLKSIEYWDVTVSIPRKYLDEIDYNDLDDLDDDIDVEDIEQAEDQGIVDEEINEN